MKNHPDNRLKGPGNKPKKGPNASAENGRKREPSSSAHINKYRLFTGAAIAGIMGLAGFWISQDLEAAKGKTDESAQSAAVEKVTPKLHGTPIAPYKPEGAEQFDRMLDLQKHWRKISLDALSRFKNADPMMPKLYEFFEKNAYFTIPQGPVITMRAFEKDAPKGADEMPLPENKRFEVVYMPEEYASGMPAPILTETGGRTVRVAANFKCMEWLGILLAHELSHVYNILIEGENDKDRSQYLAGEVKAHSLEMKLLKDWNPQVYEELISKSEKLAHTPNNSMRDFYKIANSLYPLGPDDVSERESSLGTASVLVSSQFEMARKKGATEKDMEVLYQHLAGSRH